MNGNRVGSFGRGLLERPAAIWVLAACVLLIVGVVGALIIQHAGRKGTQPLPTPTSTPSFLLPVVGECGPFVISPPWSCVHGAAFAVSDGELGGIAWSGLALTPLGKATVAGGITTVWQGDRFCMVVEDAGYCVFGADRENLATRIWFKSPEPQPTREGE